MRATEGTAVSTPRDGEEDADNPKNRAFWHKTVFTERLSKTVGKTIRLKQGFIRCHDDILKELTSINQAESTLDSSRLPHACVSCLVTCTVLMQLPAV